MQGGDIIKKHPRQCSEHQDYLRYALITFILCFTPHSGDECETKVSRNTDEGVFLLHVYILILS